MLDHCWYPLVAAVPAWSTPHWTWVDKTMQVTYHVTILSVVPKNWTFFIKLYIYYERLEKLKSLICMIYQKFVALRKEPISIQKKNSNLSAPSMMVQIQPQLFYVDCKLQTACTKIKIQILWIHTHTQTKYQPKIFLPCGMRTKKANKASCWCASVAGAWLCLCESCNIMWSFDRVVWLFKFLT